MKTPNSPFEQRDFDGINPDGKPLSAELLKTFPGCENYTERQALEIVLSLEKLVAIYYKIANAEKIYDIDNQNVVYLNNHKNIAA